MPKRRLLTFLMGSLLCIGVLSGCSKSKDDGTYDINNSLTLFKLDNNNNALDLMPTDTVASQSGVNGKYILVSGAAGATKGLGAINLKLLTMGDSLLNSVNITSFFRPEYHVINTQLVIPPSQRGKVYKVQVEVVDKLEAVIGTTTFYGVDVVSCDPLPPCLVNNQITVMVETPAGTPEEDIYLFGSLNGWSRGDPAFKLNKNPEIPNCYCITIPYPPGYADWQVGEVYVTRGLWENDALNPDNTTFIVNYTTTEMGPLWKIKVPKWRDQ